MKESQARVDALQSIQASEQDIGTSRKQMADLEKQLPEIQSIVQPLQDTLHKQEDELEKISQTIDHKRGPLNDRLQIARTKLERITADQFAALSGAVDNGNPTLVAFSGRSHRLDDRSVH